MSRTAVLFYEAFATLDEEVAYFWSAPWTRGAILFFLNKWISLAAYIVVLAEFSYFPSNWVSVLIRSCHGESDWHLQRFVMVFTDDLECGDMTVCFHSCSVYQRVALAIDIAQFIPGAGMTLLLAQ